MKKENTTKVLYLVTSQDWGIV